MICLQFYKVCMPWSLLFLIFLLGICMDVLSSQFWITYHYLKPAFIIHYFLPLVSPLVYRIPRRSWKSFRELLYSSVCMLIHTSVGICGGQFASPTVHHMGGMVNIHMGEERKDIERGRPNKLWFICWDEIEEVNHWRFTMEIQPRRRRSGIWRMIPRG